MEDLSELLIKNCFGALKIKPKLSQVKSIQAEIADKNFKLSIIKGQLQEIAGINKSGSILLEDVI